MFVIGDSFMSIHSNFQVPGLTEEEQLAYAEFLSREDAAQSKAEKPKAAVNNDEQIAFDTAVKLSQEIEEQAKQRKIEVVRTEQSELDQAVQASLKVVQPSEKSSKDEKVENNAAPNAASGSGSGSSSQAVQPQQLQPQQPAKEAEKPKSPQEMLEHLKKVLADENLVEQIFNKELWQEDEIFKQVEPVGQDYIVRYKTAFEHPDKQKLNRYDDGLPFEGTRLGKEIPGFYVNGNLIEAPSGSKYNMMMGPLENTVGHFFQAILHAKSDLIVSLEDDDEKCDLYWNRDEIVTQDGWTIRKKADTQEEVLFTGPVNPEEIWPRPETIVKRVFVAEHKESGEKRELTHLLFTNWQDKGIVTVECLEALLQIVQNVETANPITVHCSAGLGRAGTFVCAKELLKNPAQNQVALVNFFRKMRNSQVVQKPSQFGLVCQIQARALEKQLGSASSQP